MDRSNVYERLRAAIANVVEVDESEITEESYFVQDLDADSIDLLQLILSLKESFGISVHDGEVKQLLAELARFLPDAELRAMGSDELTDDRLSEVSRKLQVSTVVDFVAARIGVST